MSFTYLICELSQFSAAVFMAMYIVIAFTTREIIFLLQSACLAFVTYSVMVVHDSYFASTTPDVCNANMRDVFFSSEIMNLATYATVFTFLCLYCTLWRSWRMMLMQKIGVMVYLVGISVATVMLHDDPVWLWLAYIAYGIIMGAVFTAIIRYHIRTRIPSDKIQLLAWGMGFHDTYLYWNCTVDKTKTLELK